MTSGEVRNDLVITLPCTSEVILTGYSRVN